ncbi:YcxB family protein [Streptomyces griseoincarnatus]|uniref:YcxB family protein n=1 Tax=Promicromonospora sp. NPDC057138 TaxID=3346031 RepID=UPI00362E422E
MSEPTADVSAQRVFEAELHLTMSNYREGLGLLPTTKAIRWLSVIIVIASTVLTIIHVESTGTEYVATTIWLPIIVLSFLLGFVPDLLAWHHWRTALSDGYRLRLDTEHIAYTGTEASTSYTWPLVRKAVETGSAFHLVIRLGGTTAVCIFPKSAFPLEDHAAIRELITTKVGKLHRR